MAEGHTAIDWSEIRQLVADGYVSARRHPVEPLTIYNYTARCQYDGHWTPMTRQCRGLIADDSGQVVARPFPKFFNYGDLAVGEIPDEPFDVFEKLDGSLGVLYRTADGPAIATRGSFTSEQALRATDMLRSRYAGAAFLDGCTYLFEIIYSENRIVVDYGGESRLVLLAVIGTATGVEVEHHPGGGLELVASHVARPPAELAAMVRPNCEGFVLRYRSGLRVKVKHAEYVRLHRLLTGLSARDVWENAAAGNPVESLLDDVPDEFYDWVRVIDSDLRRQFAAVEQDAVAVRERSFATRKEAAAWITTRPYPAIMFAMLDGKDFRPLIWRLLRPAGGITFRCANEATA